MSEKVNVLCKNCGTSFSAFLQEMAEHNQKIVCPKCGQRHLYRRTDLHNSSPEQPKK